MALSDILKQISDAASGVVNSAPKGGFSIADVISRNIGNAGGGNADGKAVNSYNQDPGSGNASAIFAQAIGQQQGDFQDDEGDKSSPDGIYDAMSELRKRANERTQIMQSPNTKANGLPDGGRDIGDGVPEVDGKSMSKGPAQSSGTMTPQEAQADAENADSFWSDLVSQSAQPQVQQAYDDMAYYNQLVENQEKRREAMQNGPNAFNYGAWLESDPTAGQYSMPGGDMIASLTPEQQQMWQEDTLNGLIASGAFGAALLGGGVVLPELLAAEAPVAAGAAGTATGAGATGTTAADAAAAEIAATEAGAAGAAETAGAAEAAGAVEAAEGAAAGAEAAEGAAAGAEAAEGAAAGAEAAEGAGKSIKDILKRLGKDAGLVALGGGIPTLWALNSAPSAQTSPKSEPRFEPNTGISQTNDYARYLRTAEGQKFLEKYADRGFDDEENGWTSIRASEDPEVIADLLGMNADFAGVPGWNYLYKNSGLDLTGDDYLDTIYRFMWDSPYTVYATDMLSNPAYNMALLGGGNDLDQAAKYLSDVYGITEGLQQINPQLDANDFAMLAYLSGLSNGTLAPNLDDINRISANAGETMEYGELGKGYEDQGKDRKNARQYSILDLMNNNLTPYGDVIDAQAIDTVLGALNSGDENRKYGVKARG